MLFSNQTPRSRVFMLPCALQFGSRRVLLTGYLSLLLHLLHLLGIRDDRQTSLLFSAAQEALNPRKG